MLLDHGRELEQRTAARRRRTEQAQAFGNYIAYSLGPWDWFVNPISFRDRDPDLERNPKTGAPRTYRISRRIGAVSFCVPDPRINSWEPNSKYRSEPGPPVPDRALAEISDWLCDVQEGAGQPIKAMIAEEFGRLGGRYHCHLLIGGVAHLRRDDWWGEAFERFGRTRIEPFDPERGAAFYCAKYAAKKIGALHFIGAMPGAEFAARLNSGPCVGGADVALSPSLPRDAFHMNLSRWHR
jgi:hypothetical protein